MRQDKADIHWLSDDEYAHLVGSLRLQLNGVFAPFCCYGQDILVPGAIDEIVKLCGDFGLRVRGVDKVISLEMVRKGGIGNNGLGTRDDTRG